MNKIILIFDEDGLVHLPENEPVQTRYSQTLCRPLFGIGEIVGIGRMVPPDTLVTCLTCIARSH